MRRPADKASTYAPLWVILFSTGATLAKAVGERYLLQRTWKLSASDVATAVAGALFGYVSYRMKHGNETEGTLTR